MRVKHNANRVHPLAYKAEIDEICVQKFAHDSNDILIARDRYVTEDIPFLRSLFRTFQNHRVFFA